MTERERLEMNINELRDELGLSEVWLCTNREGFVLHDIDENEAIEEFEDVGEVEEYIKKLREKV